MKKICVTGVSGYVGKATAHALAKRGYLVIGVGQSMERPEGLVSDVAYKTCDIEDTDRLAGILADHAIEAIFHFAANKYAGLCEEDPEGCFRVNTEGTRAVLEAARRAGVSHFIFASTYAVYDLSGDTVKLTEDSLLGPQTVYGKSKLAAEQVVREYADAGHIKQWHILRYANVVGSFPGISSRATKNFLDLAIEKIVSGQSVQIFGMQHMTSDGSVARDFVSLEDIVLVHLALLEDERSRVYNVGSGRAHTLLYLVKLISAALRIPFTVQKMEAQKPEPSSVTVISEAVERDLSWRPEIHLEEIVRRRVEELSAILGR